MTEPVGPRNVGESFLYMGIGTAPQPCVVTERFDGVGKAMIDANVIFADLTRTWAFDFQLHALDCPGPIKGVCECGAAPGDPNHKFRALGRVKHQMQVKQATEHGELVYDPGTNQMVAGGQGFQHPPEKAKRQGRRPGSEAPRIQGSLPRSAEVVKAQIGELWRLAGSVRLAYGVAAVGSLPPIPE